LYPVQKRQGLADWMPKKISELQSAELKLRALLNKRDEINEHAALLRSERDTLNDQKKVFQDQMRTARDKRDALVAEMRVHKKRRDELQAKAKELIEFKKKMKGRPTGDLRAEIRELQRQVKDMELKQQTVPLTIPEERKLIEQTKARAAEVEKLKKTLAEQETITKEIKDVDKSIDALFRQADKAHEEVVRLSEEQHKAHEEATAFMKELLAVKATADKKHAEFVKLREEADAVHQKAQELRSKVIEIRKEKRMERMEEFRAVRDVNTAVRKALDDEKKREKAFDDALETLLKKGKLELS
jgi:uncharacterized coiled-coil DUF342 family protein